MAIQLSQKYHKILRILVSIFCFLPATGVSSNGLALFESDEFLSLSLKAPISRLKKQRDADPDWLAGQIILHDGPWADRPFEVEVKARGNFRRQRSSCSFPPYRLNFKKKEVKGTLFDGLDKVKLVSHCRETWKSFEGYIHKEYLVYKTLNILTDYSFRVRLVHIEYVDSEGRSRPAQHVAFFIEPADQLAERLDGTVVTDRYSLPSEFDPDELCLAELFQFMIGNTDFSFFSSQEECCHNSKVIITADGLIPVPYDFDLTGMVDVPYASVNSRLPIDSVTERYYRGLTADHLVLEKALDRFRQKRNEILALWRNAEYLTPEDKEVAIDYIQAFYEIIDEPELFKKAIINRMRSPEALEELILKRIGKAKK